jgi:glutathione synthase/RimK-type ligase-like ATP-grasp enzyme
MIGEMPRLGLVLPTSGYRGPDFVTAAAELGVDLVVATDGSLPLPLGDASVVPIDCSDPTAAAAAIVTAAADRPLDAVIGVDDSGVLIAALASAALGLRHNPVAAVAATRDKIVMREFFAAAGVPQPRFAAVDDADAAVGAADAIGYPVVVKPRNLSASRGVIRADDRQSARAAAERAVSIVADAGELLPMLVEEYLEGDEVAVEALASTGGLEVLAIFDKPDPLNGPYFEETIYVTPSRQPAAVTERIERVVGEAVAALGLVHGPVHAELRLTDDGPKVIEVASRSIGGLCGRSLRFGMLRQSLESLLIRAALGMPRRGMGREGAASGAMMIPIPRGGILRAVRGLAAVGEVEGVTSVEITVPIGRRIDPLPEGDRYLGFIFASGEHAEEVEAALREAHSLLEIEIE